MSNGHVHPIFRGILNAASGASPASLDQSTHKLADDLLTLATDVACEPAEIILGEILRRLKLDVSEGMEATGDAELADGAHSKVMFQNMLGDLIAALDR